MTLTMVVLAKPAANITKPRLCIYDPDRRVMVGKIIDIQVGSSPHDDVILCQAEFYATKDGAKLIADWMGLK